MKVVEMAPLQKNRYKVTVEDITFVLYRGEIARYEVAPGSDLSQEHFGEIMTDILPKRALNRCLYLLGAKDYTRSQLRDKLLQGFYPAKIAEAVIDRLESYGYINDMAYVRGFIVSRLGRKSKYQISVALRQRGIPKTLIESIYDQLEAEGQTGDEAVLMTKLLASKHYDKGSADQKEKKRLADFLYRRGFAGELIVKMIYS